ncbi:hypothetical protein B0A58_05570 [Flavobacterium branchiophilum NBRC 15030 = ATCC 35035]|uniref:Uncharacterized protein n=1 Tax=Flavobacterium branchiophilum TaxID=55197 RepID=A0A543G0S9_9FLAO|nr:hypothetical protein B0A58_05570 [Flavobacterium branchiophilum NBRC 15030 = ATCC 35035]TQM39696.1 hypothetical protein BC670_0519 [Flavobacterium branchiophilum]GEM56602.1 hypothetical protein FB1_28230 [Flavobacterium branchiophilum NBRC 15030 = ATCC 35035]
MPFNLSLIVYINPVKVLNFDEVEVRLLQYYEKLNDIGIIMIINTIFIFILHNIFISEIEKIS